MRKMILYTLIITAFTTPCFAQVYPTKGTYSIYIQGTLAGSSVFEMTEDKDFYTYHSKTNVNHAPYVLDLECVTKVDKKTYRPVEFISAQPARRFTTTCTPARRAANSFCGSRILTRSVLLKAQKKN